MTIKKRSIPKTATQTKILTQILPSIDDANQYYDNHMDELYIMRKNIIDASPPYYNNKFPNLSKIPITTSEAYDTIMWIMPSLVDIFSSSEDVVTIQGEDAEDDKRADKIQKLLNYQTDRLNDGFLMRYYWMLSALENNVGFVKISWVQEFETVEKTISTNEQIYTAMLDMPDIEVKKIDVESAGFSSPDGMVITPTIYTVTYDETIMTKNQPLIETVPVTEVRWASNARTLKDANFSAHKVRRTIDYLKKKEKQGIYFNIDQAKNLADSLDEDTLEREERRYDERMNYGENDLRREVDVYECYCQFPMNEKFEEVDELNDWIFTVAGESVLIGAQYNNMGRRCPIIDLVAMPDEWNVVPEKGLVELLAEIQDANVAMTRLIMRHMLISNEGRRFVNKQLVDQDDLINESPDIGVIGDPRLAVYPMPPTTLSPQTGAYMEYLQARLRRTVGVSEYNTGSDSSTLNPTATGVTAIIEQANKKIKLIARIMAETGYAEMYRFLISLNQQYPSSTQNIRLLNEDITVTADDLEGKLDLLVNVGLGNSNKQQELQSTQFMMQVLEKVGTIYPGMVTPDKAYNSVRLLLEQLGRKNAEDFINTPDVVEKFKQEQMMQQQQAAQAAAEAAKLAANVVPESEIVKEIGTSLDRMIIPAQIQAYRKLGLNVTSQDFVQDAMFKQIMNLDSKGNPQKTTTQKTTPEPQMPDKCMMDEKMMMKHEMMKNGQLGMGDRQHEMMMKHEMGQREMIPPEQIESEVENGNTRGQENPLNAGGGFGQESTIGIPVYPGNIGTNVQRQGTGNNQL